jgi:hypothetical protein
MEKHEESHGFYQETYGNMGVSWVFLRGYTLWQSNLAMEHIYLSH